MNPSAFDLSAMRARKEQYFQFARSQVSRVFKPDGTYQPATENDPRISYWLYGPLISSPNPAERAFANVMYGAAALWDEWNVFTTSSIVAHLVRERERMTPELIKRSEEHLAKFVVRDGGRSPCSGANDYVFHGYNDNMPALNVRAMILAGDVLGRADFTDQGLFYLEGLCAHFERRGLLSEYTSGTYTPLPLVCLLDVADCSLNRDAREMALACANRVLLDIMGHWHQDIGGLGGAQSRAYMADYTETLSITNALLWYLTGHPLCVNPIETLSNIDKFAGCVHHGRNLAFNLGQFCEVLSPAFGLLSPAVVESARARRTYPYEIYATTDLGQGGLLGGGKSVQTRAYHQPLYALGTASEAWFEQSGHQATLHAILSRAAHPQSWGVLTHNLWMFARMSKSKRITTPLQQAA